jgi:hypothetical protein
MTGLYASIPIYFPESLHSVTIAVGQEVAMVWLLPVHPSEIDLVKKRGWRAFEDLLAAKDPDLRDLTRSPSA